MGDSVEKLAQLYIKEVVRLHGIPVYIVFDRDPWLTSRIIIIIIIIIVVVIIILIIIVVVVIIKKKKKKKKKKLMRTLRWKINIRIKQ
jgi:cytochrome bd-type quinol oxidase subunit 1